MGYGYIRNIILVLVILDTDRIFVHWFEV